MFPILCSYSEERKRVYSIFQLKVNKNFIFNQVYVVSTQIRAQK